MATIGHTLTGLAGAGLIRLPPSSRLRWLWPGLMVLAAHLVDLVEWIALLLQPLRTDRHFVTNSPLITAGITAAVWIALAIFARVRSIWLYALVGAAIFSHLLLDHRLARYALHIGYDHAATTDEGGPRLLDSFTAEVWFYGLILVLVCLGRVIIRRDCPRRGRQAAWLLAVAATAAAATRNALLLGPAYGLALIHGGLLFRRGLDRRFLWSVVPLLPLVALLGFELSANRLARAAAAAWRQGDVSTAHRLCERALAVPTRSSQLSTRLLLSYCQRRVGDLADAEETLNHAEQVCEDPSWPQLARAALYLHGDSRGTDFDRPAAAARILRSLSDGPADPDVRLVARRRLDRLLGTGGGDGNERRQGSGQSTSSSTSSD